MVEPGQGCGCPLCRADIPVYGSLTVEESQQRQARYAQLRQRFAAPAYGILPDDPLPEPPKRLRFAPPPLRPAWVRVAAIVFCIVVWTAVWLMVFG